MKKKLSIIMALLIIVSAMFSYGCAKAKTDEYELKKISNIDISRKENYDILKTYSLTLDTKGKYKLFNGKEYKGAYELKDGILTFKTGADNSGFVSAKLSGDTATLKMGKGLETAYYTFVKKGAATPEAEKMTGKSTMVDNLSFVSMITGAHAPVPTTEWDVGGTDLGFPIYNSTTETMFFAFGDTFSNANRMGSWRSNVLGSTKDLDASDGINFDNFLTSASGGAKAVIEGHHADLYEHTKIPTGGIEIDGNMYMFYMSIREWDYWTVTYNGVVKSTDNGANWKRIYDLSWALTDTDTEIADIYWDESKPRLSKAELAADTLELINQDMRRQHDPDANITLKGRIAPNFGQIHPIDGKDGYIYIAGITGNRTGATKLGRVKKEKFEQFSEYEYFIGFNGENKPVYEKGSRGLDMIRNSEDANIIPKTNSEQSYMYNEYLGKWMMFEGNNFRTADRLEGPWSKRETVLTWSDYFAEIPKEWCINHDANEIENRTLIPYGGQVHEKYQEEKGKVFYYNLSAWGPYNSILLKVVLK